MSHTLGNQIGIELRLTYLFDTQMDRDPHDLGHLFT
jgi:hypothetical protein